MGDRLEAGDQLGSVHARTAEDAASCRSRVLASVTLSEAAVEAPTLVHGWFGG